jgi:hypothetical protein
MKNLGEYMQIISLNEIEEKLKKFWNKKRKLAFLTTFVLGLIVHFELYAKLIVGNADNISYGIVHRARNFRTL